MPKQVRNELVTVGRLLGYLKTLPPNTPLVLASDDEGNSYSPVTDFGISGLQNISDLELTEAINPKYKQALVIYPS